MRFAARERFGNGLTPLGKKLLMVYGGVYLLELLFEHWLGFSIFNSLRLHSPLGEGFRPWQPLTAPFVHDPFSPLGFLINCVVLYFFIAPVQRAMGERGLMTLLLFSTLGAEIGGSLFGGIAGFTEPYYGMMPALLTLITVFGLLNPEATVLFMFIIPVRAKYIAYGTVLVTLLTFLAKANPHGACHLGGILLGYLYFRGLLDPGRVHLWYLERRLKKKKAAFRVIDGGREKKEGDKPTIH